MPFNVDHELCEPLKQQQQPCPVISLNRGYSRLKKTYENSIAVSALYDTHIHMHHKQKDTHRKTEIYQGVKTRVHKQPSNIIKEAHPKKEVEP